MTKISSPLIPKEDPRLIIENIKYVGETGDIFSYFVRPKGDEKLPSVVVVSEIWGLNLHTKDVARRIALEGFQTIAPDSLSPLGGTPEDIDEARSMTRKLDSDENTKNFIAAVEYLRTHPQSTGKVGVTGFCWGGGVSNQVAVHSSELKAAVPFYGRQPASEDVPEIKASLLLHYAGSDEWVNPGIPAYEAALKKASVDYEIFIYEGAKHGFFNDTRDIYHDEAAKLAWKRTINFFKQKLKN